MRQADTLTHCTKDISLNSHLYLKATPSLRLFWNIYIKSTHKHSNTSPSHTMDTKLRGRTSPRPASSGPSHLSPPNSSRRDSHRPSLTPRAVKETRRPSTSTRDPRTSTNRAGPTRPAPSTRPTGPTSPDINKLHLRLASGVYAKIRHQAPAKTLIQAFCKLGTHSEVGASLVLPDGDREIPVHGDATFAELGLVDNDRVLLKWPDREYTRAAMLRAARLIKAKKYGTGAREEEDGRRRKGGRRTVAKR